MGRCIVMMTMPVINYPQFFFLLLLSATEELQCSTLLLLSDLEKHICGEQHLHDKNAVNMTLTLL